MNVKIVSDGPFGERAYETIKKKFECEYIILDTVKPASIDELAEIPKEQLEKINNSDIVITYILNPDLTLDLVEQIFGKVKYIIIGAWKGKGLKNQLESFENVVCPEIMCELEENGNPIHDEFVSKFGKPKLDIIVENDIVKKINVLRESPCGGTDFISKDLLGKNVKEIATLAGLRIQHYPCRAGRIRLFNEEESGRYKAATYHHDAFENAIKRLLVKK
ncbi:Protein of unknown function DUF166 [Methanococcus vannielii SB]|uniref:Thymidylate synthase n=1 Tax=Methanococcus vannielii (strain ATCC 35089 / DSM 1224 / JCM 13029 / OCM 148 / SB) TaxID=406327 RepID=A6UNY9_METVS|nr:DUF166 domain-containing protein [Methanococcus vannielii]ABR54211.1 Protein of unknown function DUF166 [Methanococcus vannielii SB]